MVERTPWWWGIPPVPRADMPCDAGGHWAQWAEGQLVLPELDDEAEDVLAALGGRGCRCAEIARAWRAVSGDVRVLTVGPRTPGDHVGLDPTEVRTVEEDRLPSFRTWQNVRRRRPARSTGDQPVAEVPLPADVALERWASTFPLLLVLTLPDVLQRRLVATVGHEVELAWDGLGPGDRAAVDAALKGRAAPYLHESLARTGAVDASETVVIDVQARPPGTPAVLSATRTAAGVRVDAELGADWVRTVWGREVPLRGDGFVTAVTEVTEGGPARGVALRWLPSTGNTRMEAVVEEWETGDPPAGEALSSAP